MPDFHADAGVDAGVEPQSVDAPARQRKGIAAVRFNVRPDAVVGVKILHVRTRLVEDAELAGLAVFKGDADLHAAHIGGVLRRIMRGSGEAVTSSLPSAVRSVQSKSAAVTCCVVTLPSAR